MRTRKRAILITVITLVALLPSVAAVRAEAIMTTFTGTEGPCLVLRSSKENPMIGALVARKAVADGFGALDRRDLSKFMSAWRDDGTFFCPGEILASGTFKGKSAVESWFRSW